MRRRLLVPFSGGQLDPAVLEAALRIARADDAVFVPAYLIMVPFSLALDSPLRQEVEVALPLLEAVELHALNEGVPVDARLERGRSLRDALRRLWEVESFDRILLPVSPDERDRVRRARHRLDPDARPDRDAGAAARGGQLSVRE